MRILAVVLALLGISLAACGDSNDSPSTGTPRPTANGQDTPRPRDGDQLLYARADQSLWLHDTSTGEQGELVASGLCEQWTTAAWNFDGTSFAMTCGTSPGSNRFETYVFDAAGNTLETLPDHRTLEWSDSNGMLLLLYATPEGAPNEQESLVAYNVDDLMVVAEFPGATTGSLSSDGRSVASYRPPGAACVDDCEPGLFITSLEDATESQFGDYVPLAWVSGDASLIVRSGQPAADGSGFEAFILNVETGALDPVPALNGFTQVWPAPGGNSVVYLSRLDGLGLAILDVPSLQSTEITGSKISYPSDHIPEHHVALTEDEIYWFDATGQGAPWYRANYDGTGLIELGAADSYFLRFSVSASYVSYIKPGSPEEGQPLVVATIDGDEVGDLGPSGSASAWRLLAE